MKMLALIAAAALAACVATSPLSAPEAAAQDQAEARPVHTMPDWWVAHVDFITRDGGVWISPNPPGLGDPNAPDAFGMEWRAAYGGHVLIGRLYGIEDGRETTEFWSFREFWHPGDQSAQLHQWGGPGFYGYGETRWQDGEGVVASTFWLPDGRSWREGHRNRENGDEYVTHAFDITEAGEWISKDPREWRRQRS